VPLDGNRRRVQCRQANRVHGKPRKGRSAKGVPGHGQPESPPQTRNNSLPEQ
jgi:hypothetical protein